MVSLFDVFYVFFINFRTINLKIVPISFLTKLNFYFHKRWLTQTKSENYCIMH
jgi:hypothetical protein